MSTPRQKGSRFSELSRIEQDDRLALGAAVRAARKQRGWSQERLAQESGVDRQTVNRVETAAYAPGFHNLVAIADGLGVSLATLLPARHGVSAATGCCAETAPGRRTCVQEVGHGFAHKDVNGYRW